MKFHIRHALHRQAGFHKRGFTLLETALVLAIIGIVSGGIWLAMSASQMSQRVTGTQQDLMQIVQNLRDSYGNIGNCSSLSNTALDQAHIVPEHMRTTTAGQYLNAWGGQIQIKCLGQNHVTNGLNADFDIQLLGLPSDACIRLATRMTTNYKETGLETVHAEPGGGQIGSDPLIQPLTPQDAQPVCEVGQNNNSMEFVYSIQGGK